MFLKVYWFDNDGNNYLSIINISRVIRKQLYCFGYERKKKSCCIYIIAYGTFCFVCVACTVIKFQGPNQLLMQWYSACLCTVADECHFMHGQAMDRE